MVGTDPLLTILENGDLQELLRTALETHLRENPLQFYKEIIMPRSGKLISVPSSLQEYATLTPAQESKMMDALTTGRILTKDTKITQAEDFLQRLFDESNEKEINSQTVFSQAAEENINKNSVYQAANNLGIQRRKEGRRKEAKSFWSYECITEKAVG